MAVATHGSFSISRSTAGSAPTKPGATGMDACRLRVPNDTEQDMLGVIPVSFISMPAGVRYFATVTNCR